MRQGAVQRVLPHVLRPLIALAFTVAAIAKLAALPALVEVYDKIGIGQWFRYATVVIEIAGVIGVLTRRYTVLGALLLGATMFIAALLCVVVLHANPLPALVLAVICSGLACLTRRSSR